jgi:uncharacterized low-complexity protein
LVNYDRLFFYTNLKHERKRVMTKSNKTTIALAASAALTAGLAMSTAATADANPFASAELSSGYMQLAEGKCGEGKCGGEKKADKEGKCGEGKCGAEKKAEKEGKCGEGKCGGSK